VGQTDGRNNKRRALVSWKRLSYLLSLLIRDVIRHANKVTRRNPKALMCQTLENVWDTK